MTLTAARIRTIRAPLCDLEAGLVRGRLALSGSDPHVATKIVAPLRYALSLARLTLVRNCDGHDVDVSEALAAHRWKVTEMLRPLITERGLYLGALATACEKIAPATVRQRRLLLEHFEIDRDSLEAEITRRQLVVICGGGGGAGYGYAGAFRLFDRRKLQPELLAGTSIGALHCMFRARTRMFDPAALVAAARLLNWNTVFRVLDMESRYGIPATLRLYLRSALGSLFRTQEGGFRSFEDMEIPLLVVATGITVEGLKHDLSYYEHFLDSELKPGMVTRLSRLRRIGRLASILREFISTPDALQEIVFGAEPLTMGADVLDAAGFSAAVPGVFHYDVIRDDPRMKELLDRLYSEHGITRLTEGGLVNNVPARPAYEAVMAGRLGRRNPFVLALDCFAPRSHGLVWLPVQQIVRPNVKANLPYTDLYFALDKRLSPLQVLPTVSQLTQAMSWTQAELSEHMPLVQEMCAPLPVLKA